MRALAIACAFAVGCGDATAPPDAPVADLGASLDLASGEMVAPVFTELTFVGCARLEVVEGRPRCTGEAPLTVTLVPLTPPGTDSYLWAAEGGTPDTSKAPSPSVRFAAPGSYTVTLTAGGPSGSATATGEVEVVPASLGQRCQADAQCASSQCLCAGGDGGACPGALAGGFCSRLCGGAGCAPGDVCADLSRSAAGDAVVGAAPWRHPICLPGCVSDGDCRPGFYCHEVPSLPPGGVAGGPFTWRKACFADLLGAVGERCVGADGAPDPTSCVTGRCAPLGARDVCTLDCNDAPCPPEAACAAFAGDPQHPLCLARCDMAHPCTDPLLACAAAGGPGPFGFTVPMNEPMGATFCAPKRCDAQADCAPAGDCSGPDGGSYCQ